MTETLSAVPTDIALYLYRGDPFAMGIALWNGTAPVDLTGATVRAHVRETPDSETLAATFESSIVENIITLTLTSLDTATLPPRCCWDGEVTYGDGTSQTIGFGPILVAPDVTR